MGYKIRDDMISKDFHDEYCGKEVWFSDIKVSGNSITATVFIEQENNVISMTTYQAKKLREILNKVF